MSASLAVSRVALSTYDGLENILGLVLAFLAFACAARGLAAFLAGHLIS
jgi:hypothetical protein